MRYGTIGSISTGTLRTQDLLVRFADELEHLTQSNGKTGKDNEGAVNLIWNARECSERLEGDAPREDDEETAQDLVNELQDALNDYAPPYCRFGSHDGDGADFGFWPCIDCLEEDARDQDDVIKVDAGSEPSYLMSVNDHGNVTLYKVTLEEVWSVV